MNKNQNERKNTNNPVFLSADFICTGYWDSLGCRDLSVVLTNKNKNISKEIIDIKGNIQNFPGIDYDEAFVSEYGDNKVTPLVRFEAGFHRCSDGKFAMLWTVRPDGRFWMDSWGFGAEDYCSITLYSYIDDEGNFTQPFKLYSIGKKHFSDVIDKEMMK